MLWRPVKEVRKKREEASDERRKAKIEKEKRLSSCLDPSATRPDAPFDFAQGKQGPRGIINRAAPVGNDTTGQMVTGF